MKKLLAAVRPFALAALLAVSSVEGQQPSPQTAPGTPQTAAPTAPSAVTSTPSSNTQTVVPAPSQTTNAAPSPIYAPWSIEGFYWMPSTRPSLLGGAAATTYSDLVYPHTSKYAPGILLSLPVSKTGMLVFSGFITKGSTSTTANQDVTLFGTGYTSGEFLTATYNVKDFKLSFQDLLYPFPRKEGQKWRVKTLWEVQYAGISSNLNAPLAPTTDSSGNPLINSATGSRNLIFPTLGLAGEFHPARNLEFDLNGSGFGIPHHGAIGDAEASIGYRFGHVELLVAEKYFHFETSPRNSQYFKTTLLGAYAALRLYPTGIPIPCLFCRHKNTTAATSTSSTGAASSTEASTAAPGSSSSETPATSGANQPSVGARAGSSSSTAPPPGVYVRRFSGGATLSALALSLIPARSSTVNNSSTVTTSYSTTAASERIGYGLTAQVALTERWAIVARGLFHRIGYQLSTTVTTTKPTVIAGVQTTVTNSTGVHEDTRASLIDVPLTARYYTRDRHEPGPRMFVEAGGAWRDTLDIRTSTSTTNAQSQLSCCTFTPTEPRYRTAPGVVLGAGVLLIDAFGIHFAPEVQYTRWMKPTFESLTTDTRRNEISAGFTLGF